MERDAVLNRTSIDRLDPNATRVTVFGIVIAKQAVRSIAASSASSSSGVRSGSTERSVLNFTLRDSLRDTVNAACWGDGSQVAQVAAVFRIGDCVRVTNAVVRNRNMASTQELYSPDASSPFHLVLSVDREPRSEVSIADEEVFLELIPLLQVPLHEASHVTTLADLLYSGHEMNDRHVSLLVGIQKVGPVTPISTKDGRQAQKVDITVCDQSHIGFKVTLWDDELIHLSHLWKAKETVLYIADARVRLSNVFGLTASADGRTVITVNPDMPEAMALFDYIQGVDVGDDAGEEIYVDTTVYTASQVNREVTSRAQSGNMTPFSGVLFAFLNQFDLDGPGARLVASRCGHCNFRLRPGEPLCTNGTCPVAMGQTEPQFSEELDIPVMWTDHTGSVERSRLSGRTAEGLLGITVEEFKGLSENDLTSLKWNFLLERFKVQFKVNFATGTSNRDPVVRVVSVSPARPQEFLEKVFNVRV
ncbi:meiosis-specific with OB domain-containing protein [Dermacentor silvarum]|uniref:meiosis-specific with OB domain-containing protein n=1 Tax=Dermacentor silvarum TaxID=543639 RepID=UPI002100B5B4|nr:meiosis-specific with OB domain-containing protein [Dermacentor silvarum]